MTVINVRFNGKGLFLISLRRGWVKSRVYRRGRNEKGWFRGVWVEGEVKL